MDKIIIANKQTLQPKHKAEHPQFEYTKYEAISRNDYANCYATIYEIPPGKSNYPYHCHVRDTEVFYIISGSGTVKTPDGDKTVIAGDIVIFPPGENGAHRLTNTSATELLTYVDFGTATSPDVVFYPDSGKVGVIVHGKSSTFFKEESAVDYYNGE